MSHSLAGLPGRQFSAATGFAVQPLWARASSRPTPSTVSPISSVNALRRTVSRIVLFTSVVPARIEQKEA
jgi:hypothetical protein